MAFVVVPSLLELVEQQLLQPNPCLVHLDDRETIVSLRDKLHVLQAFLEESEMKTNDPEAKKILDTEIQDVATKAEGQIGSKLRQVYLAANGGECLVQACQELYQTLQQVLKDIKAVEVRILMHKTNFDSIASSSTNNFKEENIMVGVSSPNDLNLEEIPIVGLDSKAAILISELLNSDPRSLKREVFLIIGIGGLGKTTLAKRIYGDPRIRNYFDIKAWTVVSQEHYVKEMLVHLLDCILPVTSEISNKGEAELAEQLRRSVMGKRYLIVLDDVWTTKAWDAIEPCFPDNFNGSRILITTRFYEVGKYSSEKYFRLQYLSDDESWKIISRKVFEKGCFPCYEFLQLGEYISKQCRGIPLAIVLIAGLLATVNESLDIWEDIAKTMAATNDHDNNTILEIIQLLCYNYLPNHLKACFLYFGVFPEDSNILVKKLINLWVAEGFLKPERNKSLEEVAKSYLYDLINRNLVQIDKRSVDGKIKTCKIHDMVHEMCVREAKNKNIMFLINENCALEASRWISCQSSHLPITLASYGNHTSDEIRSILYFGRDFYLSKCRLVYPCLKLLRVLDLSLLKYSHGMPSGIADLIHLRYLALSTIGSLYKFKFFKLQHLQTLIVSSWMGGCHLQLPSNILDLLQLSHLHLEKKYSQCFPNLVQENLQTFYWLKVASSNQNKNFKMVPNLKELGIYIEGELVHDCFESFGQLHLLEKLKFEMGRVEHFYLPTSFPPNLKQLTLRYTYVPWKEIDIIAKLPNLEILKLKDFAFCGSMWAPMEVGFKKLKVLLFALLDVTHWFASAAHFPVLETLVLRYCWELKQIPIGFANIETLKSIVIESCYSSLVNSAHEIQRLSTYDIVRRVDQPAFCVYNLGTKVELPNNDHSGEESVELLNNDGSEEESVELPNNEGNEEESVELPYNEGNEGESVEFPKKKVLKALSKKVLNALKKKLVKALN